VNETTDMENTYIVLTVELFNLPVVDAKVQYLLLGLALLTGEH